MNLEIFRGAISAPIFWPFDVKSALFGKVPDAGKDRRRQEKGLAAYETVGQRHPLT